MTFDRLFRWDNAARIALRIEDLVSWARELIAMYAPIVEQLSFTNI